MAELPKRNFTGGEIAPSLHGRADLTKFQTGLATLRNFTIKPQGGAVNRTGTEFIGAGSEMLGQAADRLIPFEFNKDQAYILEFGQQYMRVIRNGGHVLLPADTITAINLTTAVQIFASNTYSSGDEVFITGIVGSVELNNKRFRITSVTGSQFHLATGPDPADVTPYVSGGTSAKIFTLTTPYLDAFALKFTQSADVMTITEKGQAPRDLSRTAHDAWTLTAISYVPTISAPVGISAVAGGTGASTFNKTYEYVVTVVDDTGQESVQSLAASVTTTALDGTHFVTVGWGTVANADYYNIYKAESEVSDVYGWIGESKTLSFRDYNLLPDITDTPPIARDPFSGADDFPGAVSYYQQRQVFGRTNNNRQTLFATQSGNFHSMNISRPIKADDALERTIASYTVNEIRHFVDLNALIILTSGGVWRVTEGQDGVLTPDSVGFRQQAGSRGSSDVRPVVIGDTSLYVQDGGRSVRDLGYSFQTDSYFGNEVSLLAKHLFEGTDKNIIDIAYAEEPDGIVWCVLENGDVMGLTYLKEHQVFGWHRHDFSGGKVLSVAAIPSGDPPETDTGHEVYFLIERTIDGATVQYVERLKSRVFDTNADLFFVDSGLTYDAAPATTITGLDHLEGETVVALADGNVVKTNSAGNAIVVTSGAVTFAESASKIHIGIPIVADFETLDIDPLQASVRGKPMNVGELIVKVQDSRGGKVGPDSSSLTQEFPGRTVADNFAVLTGKTTEHRVFVDPQWSSNGHIFIRQDDPLPLAILSIVPDIDVG